MANPEAPVFQLADLTLDLGRGRLTGANGDVPLRRKPFDLLCHLVRHSGQVLSKEDLMAAVWPDVTVSDDSLTQCISELRRALGPKGATLLRTVPRRGYLFSDPGQPSRPAAVKAPAPPQGPIRAGSIAIMPFSSLSPLPPQHQLPIDGMVNDIISRMAQLRSFHVIARASTFASRHLAAQPRLVRAALNVDYVVNGSAEWRGNAILLHIDLLHSADGSILWTRRLEFPPDAMLGLIDELTDQIVAAVASEITTAERHRAALVPEQSLDAWQLYHRGLGHAFRFDAAEMAIAQHCFDRARQRDPSFARAHGAASFCHYFYAFSGQCTDRAAEVRAALACADQAIQADENNPTAQWSLGRALWLDGQSQAGLHHAERAISLSPSFAHASYTVAFIQTHHGDPQKALIQLDRTEALSPLDPFLGAFQITRAVALARLGQLEQAAVWARKAAADRNAYSQMKGNAAVILAAAGHLAEARALVATIRRDQPDYSKDTLLRALYAPSEEIAALIEQTAPLIGM